METLSVSYCFKFPDSSVEIVELQIDTKKFELVNPLPNPLPSWTNLTFHQCPHCPFDIDTQSFCPLAASQVNLIRRLAHFLPYQKVLLEVSTAERKISKETTVQSALGSLMGLMMPTSGCPHTAYFKPMARFHVPLASSAETIYRSVSMYLMAQYFLAKAGDKVDIELKGLGQIYENIHLVNTSIAERFLAASKKDSSVDAVVQLDIYVMTFLEILEEPLEEIKYLFHAYLQ